MTRSGKNRKGSVVAVSVSEKKGTKKTNVACAELKADFGITADAHAGTKNRQVSLLAIASIEKMIEKGLRVGPGDFAENITVEGIDLIHLPVGATLKIGSDVVIEVSQLGKECHRRCAIYYQAGDCVMPREGIFARVLKGGVIKPKDTIIVCSIEREARHGKNIDY